MKRLPAVLAILFVLSAQTLFEESLAMGPRSH